jgi:hypothetical protein
MKNVNLYHVIDSLNFYIPNYAKELEAEKQLKEIIEVNHSNLNITNVRRYDLVYGEMWLSGTDNDTGKEVSIKWNYFNGEILIKL